jgi:hypothetical protein
VVYDEHQDWLPSGGPQQAGHLLSATDTMPEGRANSILRKMMSGDQVDTEFETVSVELATVDNDPADARERWI